MEVPPGPDHLPSTGTSKPSPHPAQHRGGNLTPVLALTPPAPPRVAPADDLDAAKVAAIRRGFAAVRPGTTEEDLLRTYPLHPKQRLVYDSPATEILFGGAAGPGKSHLLRVALIIWCALIPGLQCYLFRRTFPELADSHIHCEGGFPELLAPWIADGRAKINYSDFDIAIGRSRIHLRHVQHESHLTRYQGAQMHVLAIDELPTFPWRFYQYLRGRLRATENLPLPKRWRDRFPRVLATGNPGGVGHDDVKLAFVDPKPEMEIWRTPDEDGGMLRQFVPAKLADNPSIKDPDQYRRQLAGLGPQWLVDAWLHGKWDIAIGGLLTSDWDPTVHVIPPFVEIPSSWEIRRSLDWGTSAPYSVGWWAKSDGTEYEIEGEARVAPPGTVFRVAELYGWTGKPNEGTRELAREVGRRILELERGSFPWGRRVRRGPADPSIFTKQDGRSVADEFAAVGVSWAKAPAGPGSRESGAEVLRARLRASLAHPMEEPGLFVVDTCRQWLRTVPTIPSNPKNPDDADTAAEDHCYDETRYYLTAPDLPRSYAGPLR